MDELASARQDELALHAIHMHPKKIAWNEKDSPNQWDTEVSPGN